VIQLNIQLHRYRNSESEVPAKNLDRKIQFCS